MSLYIRVCVCVSLLSIIQLKCIHADTHSEGKNKCAINNETQETSKVRKLHLLLSFILIQK